MDSSLSLERWNLPQVVLESYAKRGLKKTFQWQTECLSINGVLDGRNLVYAAPTSAGKTLVAEILMLKRVLNTGKKVLLILPFISLAREKLFTLRELFEEAGVRVDGYMGGYAPTNGFSSIDIAVCTIEKANGLINKLIEEKNIDQIGMLVVDELHMVGDEGRGYIIELLLTKIRFMSRVKDLPGNHEIQIIGMSATLPNLDLLADWLGAALYVTEYRPVPLQRCLKVGNNIYNEKLAKIRDFTSPISCKGDDDNIPGLCYETLEEGHSVLIFCPTKNWCEKLAKSIAHQFYDINSGHQKDDSLPFVKLKLESLKEIYDQLALCHVGVDAILNQTIPLGVAYHHAGLTTEERDIIEAGFRIGAIRVLVATSTLSSGVNLPARRVIIRTPMFNRKVLDVRTYLQMTGRAGRKGVDDRGESILVCRPTEQTRGKALLTAKPLPIKSCLMDAKNEELTMSMKRAILEIIVNGIASTYSSVMDYTSCTLLSAQLKCQVGQNVKGPLTRRKLSSVSPVRKHHGFSEDVIKSCIQWLTEHEFVYLQDGDRGEGDLNNKICRQKIIATQLGRAALLSSLPTADALVVLADLHQAMKALALDTELHLIYLVTPIFCYNDWTGLDWYQYLNVYENLPNSHKSAANLIGVTGQFLISMASGAPIPKRGKQAEKMERLLGTHRRFYAALALHDLVQEVPLSHVCQKYSCNRGMLQQLQQSAASFAGMVTTFCEELGWWSLEVLLREFQTRLAFGVQRELMDLMQISLLNCQRARALHSAGITSCKILSETSASHIELILRNSSHFQTERKAVNESQWEVEERRRQRNIHVTGHNGLGEYEAAKMIIRESKRICGAAGSNNMVSSQTVKKPVSLHDNSCNKLSRPEDAEETEKHSLHHRHENVQEKLSNPVCKSELGRLADDISEKNCSVEKQMTGTNDDLEHETGYHTSSGALQRTDEFKNEDSNSLHPISIHNSKEPIKVLNDSKWFDISSENELDNLISDVRESQFCIKSKVCTGTSPKSDLNEIKLQNVSFKEVQTSNKVTISEKNDYSDARGSTTHSISYQEQTDFFDFNIESRPEYSSPENSDVWSDVDLEPITLHLSSASDNSSDKQDLPDSIGLHATPLSSMNSYLLKYENYAETKSVKTDHATTNNNNCVTDSKLHQGYDEKLAPKYEKALVKSPKEPNGNRDSNPSSAVTSLTDSQICAVFDNSDFSKLETSFPIPSIKNGEGGIIQNGTIHRAESKMKTNVTCELSPGAIAAMDVTFSPCITNANVSTVSSCINPSKLLKASTPKGLTVINHSGSKTGVGMEKNGQITNCPQSVEASNMSLPCASVYADDSVDDLFECSLNQVTQLNSTTKTKSPKTFTLADRTFKLNPDMNHHQSFQLINCGSAKSPSAVHETLPSKERLSPSSNDNIISNFEHDGNMTPKRQYSMIEKEQLILSSQKDMTKFSKNCSKQNSEARKDIVDIQSIQDSKPTSTTNMWSSVSDTALGKYDFHGSSESLPHQSNLMSNEDSCLMPSPVVSTGSINSQRGLNIIDVCTHSELFDTFLREWATKSRFSLAIATRKEIVEVSKTVTNSNSVVGGSLPAPKVKTYRILGIAVCWGKQDAYYLSLEKEVTSELGLYTDNREFAALMPPPVAKLLDLDTRKSRLRSSTSPMLKKNSILIAFDVKTQLKVLMKLMEPKAAFWQDPTVAAWMLDPSSEPQTLSGLVNRFIPDMAYLLNDVALGRCSNLGSIACNTKNDDAVLVPARIRACAEAACSYHLMKKLRNELKDVGMCSVFSDLEMPHIQSLLCMELNGIGFDKEKCRMKISELHDIARSLEKDAYLLAKKRFNLGSPLEVANVLYGDLGLPPGGSEEKTVNTRVKPGCWRRGLKKRKKGSWSTKKEILELLRTLHPLPGIILNWRQVSFTLTNSLHPLCRVSMVSKELGMYRVHPECVTHSATGRVGIAEPNIQNVPKPFIVKSEDGKSGVTEICIRDLFLPAKGCVLLAADYSQLEIRIFAHLSGDSKLLEILNSDSGDVFKMIAAQWKSISVTSVSADDRQRAKQICYGMLYGIGAKALSQQLSIDERSAEQFMESFLRSFPAMKCYIMTLVKRCQEKGYVETLLGRRRYLPAIKDSNMSMRSQAERQAVNTTIQGSAADVVKTATIKMHKIMKKKYKIVTSQSKQIGSSLRQKSAGKICHLVLHLHDELIFEVKKEIVDEAAAVVRSCMENVMELKVKLPVRLSVGQSWGKLKDYYSCDKSE